MAASKHTTWIRKKEVLGGAGIVALELNLKFPPMPSSLLVSSFEKCQNALSSLSSKWFCKGMQTALSGLPGQIPNF